MTAVPRIAVLVDLPRGADAGGHVKYWERIAQAAVSAQAPIDLTVYCSGDKGEEVLSPFVRYRTLPPVFSTARLKFLPYVPAHTDLASFHPDLADELPEFDLIHCTDGYFAFAQTAEKIAKWHDVPLVTSFHTDTPAYAELFTRQTVRSLLGVKVGSWVDRIFSIAKKERAKKERRMKKHLRACSAALSLRDEDRALAKQEAVGDIRGMRLGVDKSLFVPRLEARAEINRQYDIKDGRFLALFVGRVDVGKNVPLLIHSCAEAIRRGVPLHLMIVGQGPLCSEAKEILGDDVTLVGLCSPEELAGLYASADCLTMTSEIEIGGMVALEAVACGCPVLVSCRCGADSLDVGMDAFVPIESTIDAWAGALADLSADKAQQETLRRAALVCREQAVASWEDVLMQDFLPVWLDHIKKGNRKCLADAY